MRILRKRSNGYVSGDLVDGASGIIYEKSNDIKICVCDAPVRSLVKDKRSVRVNTNDSEIIRVCSPIDITLQGVDLS